jgi:spore maturation protein CgeB
MKILIVGSDEVYSIERFYERHLLDAGVKVAKFPAQSIFYAYYQPSVINKVLFKAGLSSITQRINEQFKQQITGFRPDIVWVFKGMEILPSSLEWARKQAVKLVNYNPDNPFIFTGKGSGNKNVADSIGLYDLHFTYNLAISEELKDRFLARVAYLPFGYEFPAGVREECMVQQEVVKCCMLGNPDKQRAAFIQELAEKGIEIDIYGNQWGKFVSHPGIKLFPPVYNNDFWKTLYRYRVQLNMMRVHNPQSHNMRSFEVPAIGGIQLAPDTPEHRSFFTPGKEIFLYKDIPECITAIRHLLSLRGEQANEIRRNAHLRSIQSGYSYHNRAQEALAVMEELLHG